MDTNRSRRDVENARRIWQHGHCLTIWTRPIGPGLASPMSGDRAGAHAAARSFSVSPGAGRWRRIQGASDGYDDSATGAGSSGDLRRGAGRSSIGLPIDCTSMQRRGTCCALRRANSISRFRFGWMTGARVSSGRSGFSTTTRAVRSRAGSAFILPRRSTKSDPWRWR